MLWMCCQAFADLESSQIVGAHLLRLCCAQESRIVMHMLPKIAEHTAAAS